MLHGFDHAVIAVGELSRAEAGFRTLGFTVSARPDVGSTETENRLICFQDGSYIEIFSLRDPVRPTEHRWAPMLAKGDGWADYSVHVDDVTAEARRLAASGLPHVGPRTGGRALADGRRWGVAVLLTGRGVASPVLPFMIQDTEPRAVRVPDGAAAMQPCRAAGIVGVTLLTTDLAAIEPALATVFGSGAKITQEGTAAGRRYAFAGRWVEVVEPGADTPNLADHLRRRGEGLYEVTLGRPGQTQPGDGELLPTVATHGARLRLAT